MDSVRDRREFLRAAAAAGITWAAADLAQVDAALAWAAQPAAARGGVTLQTLTPDQAAAVEAMTTRILPSVDGRPGAREAGVVRFVDRALATFNPEGKPLYAEGVADLNRRAAAKQPGVSGFAALAPAQQDEVLRDIEQTPFFQAARFDTIVGAFGLPTWGGNRDHAGWRLIGFEHRPAFQPPFGYYDAEVHRLTPPRKG
jgi:gluconate 2-dehydrogenase gamma chain